MCVINVSDSTLNLDHLKSLTALGGIRAHGATCGPTLRNRAGIVTLVSSPQSAAFSAAAKYLQPFYFCECEIFALDVYVDVSPAKLQLSPSVSPH